jgi:hypothetical protein
VASHETVLLLEVEPDIGRFLSADEKAEAARLVVPVVALPKQAFEIEAVLTKANSFAALVLDGMLLQSGRVWEHTALQLLGPGDVLTRTSAPRSMLVTDAGYRAAAETRVAMLGNEVLLAARRWPRIVAGLNARLGEQSERLSIQMTICQLPRVDQRVLALMWLLAEIWGQVTPAGTTLPLALTHDAIGALIGGRRPTVTLALSELTERGAIVRQDRGWLLVERPPQESGPREWVDEPVLLEAAPSGWAAGPEGATVLAQSYADLLETVRKLQEEHLQRREQVRDQLRRVASSRERIMETRERVAQEAVRRRQAPSS